MKRLLPFFLALALLCGCTAPGPKRPTPIPMESVEAGTPSPSLAKAEEPESATSVVPVPESSEPMPLESEPEEREIPELTYETREVGYTIHRIQLDPKGMGLNVYFDVPVFEEIGEGYKKINTFFEELADTFFSTENSNIENIWERAYDLDGLYYKWMAQVTFWNEKLVSVTYYHTWMAGGVNIRGRDGYTFRTDTGERLTLEEVTGESEEKLRLEITEALRATLTERLSDVESCLAEAEIYDIEDFDFALDEDGWVQLYFDSCELGRSTAESNIIVYPWLMADRQWDAWR